MSAKYTCSKHRRVGCLDAWCLAKPATSHSVECQCWRCFEAHALFREKVRATNNLKCTKYSDDSTWCACDNCVARRKPEIRIVNPDGSVLTRFIRVIEVSTQGTATIVWRAVTYDGRCVIVTTLADALTVIAFKDREIRELKQKLIAGFYEEEIPLFQQGEAAHELQELVTAEEVAWYVREIQRLRECINSKLPVNQIPNFKDQP